MNYLALIKCLIEDEIYIRSLAKGSSVQDKAIYILKHFNCTVPVTRTKYRPKDDGRVLVSDVSDPSNDQ